MGLKNMKTIPRVYDDILRYHLKQHRQMSFICGPRQVGKTTTCRHSGTHYISWDNLDDRNILLKGPEALFDHLGFQKLEKHKPILVLDEIHKYSKWKILLKGIFDTYSNLFKIIVTGSSQLNIYRKGGDSLMGRYFLYRMHPLSIAELLNTNFSDQPIQPVKKISNKKFESLWKFGGFPEPFLKNDLRFSNQWKRLRRQQLLKEDIRELTNIQELGQLEVLERILAERSGTSLIYSSLARDIHISVETAKRWVYTLTFLYYGFLVYPWFKNITKSLRKEPKWFLHDWSGIQDPGQRAETFIACHLLKAVDGWTDLGLGNFELRYLRDLNKNEVDFIVIRDGEPWILVEVKKSSEQVSPKLSFFQKQLKAPHAFQVVIDMEYVEADCFQNKSIHPIIVPARTFLSQLF